MILPQTINGPVWYHKWPRLDHTEIVKFCSKRDMQFDQNFSNIENRQPYRLKAIEPHSTFCICERYIVGQNSIKLLAVK